MIQMVNALFIFLLAIVIIACLAISLKNRNKKQDDRQAILEFARQSGIVSEDELEYISDGGRPYLDSCIISSAEILEAINHAVNTLNDLEETQDDKSDKRWVKMFGFQSDINLDLKELTLFSMNLIQPLGAIELIARIIEMNLPMDALDMAQSKTATPNYIVLARMVWVQFRKRLDDFILSQKPIYKNNESLEQALTIKLTKAIITTFNIPSDGYGFAVLMALIIAKVEFGVCSDEK